MSKELLSRWAKSLRSGRYKQHKQALTAPNNYRCALGVLSEVITTGSIISNIEGEFAMKISRMNDLENKSFEEIANYIENYTEQTLSTEK